MPKTKRTSTGSRARESVAEYYDRRGVLDELVDEPAEFALDVELRREILSGQRRRRLKNLSIKLDPMQIQALRKLAAMKSIPYQTLIRLWLAERIRRELHLPPQRVARGSARPRAALRSSGRTTPSGTTSDGRRGCRRRRSRRSRSGGRCAGAGPPRRGS